MFNTTFRVKQFIIFTFLFAYASGGSFVVTTEGLYNSSDPIVILNINNFYKTVLGTDNAWIIEFYSSQCGFCINFAPSWRAFSYDVMDWNHTIRVGAINCIDKVNVPLCRDFEISSYPNIRLFGTKTKKGELGFPIPKANSEELQKSIIEFLVEKQLKNLGSPTWVNLLPYESKVESIYHNAPSKAEHAVLIVDQKGSMIARQSILDLGGYKSVYVRKINDESPALDYIDIPSIPALVVVDKNGKYDTLKDEAKTREEVTAIIMKEFDIVKKKLNGKESTNTSGTPAPVTQNGKDQVYMVDIENALFNALMIEVFGKKNISGENYDALVNYIDILIRYLPTRPQVLNFLKDFQKYLKEHTYITGEEVGLTINKIQLTNKSILPEMKQFKGCLGSKPTYRGYTCGLWVTFHTLTVNAVLREKDNPQYNPKDVIRGIHGYIKYFFTCDYCSRHFQEMYSKDAETYVKKPNDEIMWFWKSHNIVNMRLKGDLTEDPTHPKQLFPTKKNCPECYQAHDNSFHEENVLKYLKKIYDGSNISYEGAKELPSITNGTTNSGTEIKASLKFSAILTCSIYFISKFVVSL